VIIEAAGDVGEVVGRFGLVTEVAEARDRFVEDELALADQEHAALGVIGWCPSRRRTTSMGPHGSGTDRPG
jgi:hypothetical protein